MEDIMAKNKVQFQRGLSLGSFLTEYGEEQQCHEALFRLRWPKGFICPECGYTGYCLIQSRKVYQCHRCRRQVSVISGTIFASTKLALKTWFLAIYLITQAKDGISSLNLARTLGISADAALRMKHKIQQTMKERDDARPLSGEIQLDDAYWGGKKRDGKRGRGASGKTPLVAAVSFNEDGHPIAMRLSAIAGFTKSEIGQWSRKHLAPRSRVISDGLGCFPAVQASDCNHEAFITGSGSRYRGAEVFKWVNTILGNVKNSIHGTYHAISEEHLPRYLAEFCYRFNRRFKLDELIPRFAYVAVRTPPMPQRLLKLAEVRW
jgi:transposase-like protein